MGAALFILIGVLAILFIWFITRIINSGGDTAEIIGFCILVMIPLSIIAYYFFKNSKFPISKKADDEAALLKEKTYNDMKKKHMF